MGEREIRQFAANNLGVITRSKVHECGSTDDFIKWKLAKSRWAELHPGVYYLNVTPLTWDTQVLAAVEAAGPGALASHRTAASLWGLDGIRSRIIELTVPFNDDPEPTGAIVHRTRRQLPASLVGAIPVTTVERTVLDLAALLHDRVLEKVARSAVWKGLTTEVDLDQAIAKWGGRGVTGTRRLRRIIRIIDGDRTASVSEIDLKQSIRDAPIPSPVLQLRIVRPNGENAYPDFAWPDRMKIVEVDGFEAHGSPEQLQADLARQNDLMSLGWDIRRFTATEIRLEPQRVIDEIVAFIDDPVL